MSFWLARKPSGQHSDHIQRFDPRFWTVNFPRPMMASVVTPAADALRVECSFHIEGELAGLIWESEDTRCWRMKRGPITRIACCVFAGAAAGCWHWTCRMVRR